MVAPVVTELASHQCGQVSIPAGYHVWVEFVVASGLAPSVFTLAGIPVFSLLKNQLSKLQSKWRDCGLCVGLYGESGATLLVET